MEEELKKLWNEKRYCQNFVEAIVDGLSDDVRNVKQELSTGNYHDNFSMLQANV